MATTMSGGAEPVLLEYTGTAAGAQTFLANGHPYRVAGGAAARYIEAPREDAQALIAQDGRFRLVEAPAPPPAPEATELPEPAPEKEEDALAALGGIGAEIANALRAVGINSPADVRAVTDEALLGIPGIGPKTLEKLRAELA